MTHKHITIYESIPMNNKVTFKIYLTIVRSILNPRWASSQNYFTIKIHDLSQNSQQIIKLKKLHRGIKLSKTHHTQNVVQCLWKYGSPPSFCLPLLVPHKPLQCLLISSVSGGYVPLIGSEEGKADVSFKATKVCHFLGGLK